MLWESEKSKDLEVPDNPAHVRVSVGRTINIGSYESLRVDCSVEIPCDRKNVNGVMEKARLFVFKELAETIERYA